MSSLTGFSNDIAAAGQGGYGLYNQLNRSINGASTKVAFILAGKTVVQFDVMLNETHQFATMPTAYPIEDGANVTDHVSIAPVTLNLTGVVGDYPVETKAQLINSTISSVGVAVTSPLGALGALGSTVGFSALAAVKGSVSRSAKVFNDLQALMGVPLDQRNIPAAKRKRSYPQVFDVVTRLRRYPSMVITALQLNRDSTSGPSNMVFTVGLQQIQVAFGSTTLISTVIPEKTQRKSTLAESESSKDKYAADREAATKDSQFVRDAGSAVRELLPGQAP